MEYTYEKVTKWFDQYFEDVRNYQGNLETVPNLKRYFAPDFELMMYTAPSSGPREPMSRDALLMSFVHPGLQEDILPHSYAVDLKQMIVAVQFEIRFTDKPSGTAWAPIQASAHYHLTLNKRNELVIRRIYYWTEALPAQIFEFWARRRDEALTKHAMNYINSKH